MAPGPAIAVTHIQVRSTDIDSYGHVNNARYVAYFEWGRFDWMRVSGLDQHPLANETGFVVVNVNVNYRKEARLHEQLVLRTRLIARGKSSVRYAQVLKNAGGVVVADGEVVLAAFNVQTRSAATLSPEVGAAIDGLIVVDDDGAPTGGQ